MAMIDEAARTILEQTGMIIQCDEDNLADLERLTNRYPRVQWILAHCARSYYDRPLLKAADRLRAFRRAVSRHGYGPAEIEKLFYGNALQLVTSGK